MSNRTTGRLRLTNSYRRHPNFGFFLNEFLLRVHIRIELKIRRVENLVQEVLNS